MLNLVAKTAMCSPWPPAGPPVAMGAILTPWLPSGRNIKGLHRDATNPAENPRKS